jgi:hypothetical protein
LLTIPPLNYFILITYWLSFQRPGFLGMTGLEERMIKKADTDKEMEEEMEEEEEKEGDEEEKEQQSHHNNNINHSEDMVGIARDKGEWK